MTNLILLAKTAGETPAEQTEAAIPLDLIWEYITSINTLEALAFVSFGTICLLYGLRIFKALVVISFALIGLFAGAVITERISPDQSGIMLGIILAAVLAIAAMPLMRWGVSILGAAAGGVITAGIWYACQFPEQYIWAGGLVGIVAGGMISFIVFKIAIMLFSSLGGSSLLIAGAIALLHIYPATAEEVKQLFFESKWFVPAAVTIPTAAGIYLQNKFNEGVR